MLSASLNKTFPFFPLSYFLFQPVHHDWYNKGCGMSCAVCGMVHVKDPLLPIGKSSLCGCSSRFPLSLCEWSHVWRYITVNKMFLSVSLNKTFPSLLSSRHSLFMTSVHARNINSYIKIAAILVLCFTTCFNLVKSRGSTFSIMFLHHI